MPSNVRNGKPRIAVVSDRDDQSLQDLVVRLRETGAFVDVLKDVYTAMRGLAGGATLDRVVVDVRTLDREEMRFLKLAPRYFSTVDFSVPLLPGTKDRLGSRMDRFHCASIEGLVAAVDGAEVAAEESAEPTGPDLPSDAGPASQIDQLVASQELLSPAAEDAAPDTDEFIAEPMTEAEALEEQAAEAVAPRTDAEAYEPVPDVAIETDVDVGVGSVDEVVLDPVEVGEPLFESPPEEAWETHAVDSEEAAIDSQMVPPASEPAPSVDESWEETVAAAYEEVADAQAEQDALELGEDDEVSVGGDAPPSDEESDTHVADSSWGEPFEDMPAEPLYDTPREIPGPIERGPLSTDGGLGVEPEGPSLHEAVRRRMAGDDPRFVLRRRPPSGRVPPSGGEPGLNEATSGDEGAQQGDEASPPAAPDASGGDSSALSSEEMDALLRDELGDGDMPAESDGMDARDGGAS